MRDDTTGARVGLRGAAGRRVPMLPWPLALALICLLHGIAAFFLLRLHANNAPEAYYPPDSPAIQLRDALRREFPSDEVLTLVFRGPSLYGEEFLSRLDGFRREVESHPLVDRVFAVTTVERIGGTDDGFEVGPLVDADRLGGTPEALNRRRVLDDRFAPGLVASRDGRYMAVAVRPTPLQESTQRQQLRAATMAALDRAGLAPYYVGDAGPLTLDVVQLQAMEADTAVFVPITVSLALGLMWWLVGAVRPVAFGALAMSTAVAPSVALIPAIGAPYTMAAAILPSLLSAYTMATLMHLYAAVQRAQRAGLDNPSSIEHGLADTIKPGALNVVTTGAGLLSLLLVPIPPIQVFGAVGAAGTALVFVTVFFLLPPLLVRWDRRPWPQRASGLGRLGRISARLAVASMRHARWIVVGTAALIMLCVPFVLAVKVESNLLSYFRPDHPVNEVTRIVDSRFAGATVLEISLRGQGRDSLQDVATLKAVRGFQDWLERLPEVDRTLSMADLVEEMHWAMNAEDAAFRKIPDDDKLLRQYLLVYDGRDLFELVNRDFERARVMVNLNVHGATEIGRVIDGIRAHLARQPVPGVEIDIGGHGRLFSDQADLLVEGQIRSFFGAFLQIFVLMALMWRSAKSAAVCMVPNLAPLFFVFVLMGAAGKNLDMATVMIAGVVLGITVDDTIHLFHQYRRRRAQGMSNVFSIARSFESSGRAVLATSILLVSQFLLLGFSSFIPTANFGQLTAVGLLAGQAFELLLLPALLLLTAAGVAKKRAEPAMRVVASDHARVAGPASGSAETLASGAASVPAVPIAAADGIQAPAQQRRVLVCLGRACRERGSVEVWRQARIAERLGLIPHGQAAGLTRTSCLGRCEDGPVVQVVADGQYRLRVDKESFTTLVVDELEQQQTERRRAETGPIDGARA